MSWETAAPTLAPELVGEIRTKYPWKWAFTFEKSLKSGWQVNGLIAWMPNFHSPVSYLEQGKIENDWSGGLNILYRFNYSLAK